MVTLIKYGALSGGEKYNVNVLSLDGLSTDTKPTRIFIEYGSDGREVGRIGIPNGSLYTEIDTGDTYMYDADGATWHKVSLGGGGGGGGTTDYSALTNKPSINNTTLSGNKTSADLGLQSALTSTQLSAVNSGINSTKVAQITTNENNILSEQQKTTGMDNGGDNYISINGIPIYCDTSAPNGVIIPNALGVGWGTGTHTYTVGDNLFNYETMAVSVTNAILDASGTEIASENWVISDYIPCNGTSFSIGYVGGNTPAICLYDKDKRYITGKTYNTGGASSKQAVNITSQSTAKYIRFSYCLASGPSYVDISTIMLNKGNSLKPFAAFSGAWTE